MLNSEAVQAWIQGQMATFRILVLVSKTEIRTREFSFSSRSLRMKIINPDLVSMSEIGGDFFSVSRMKKWLSLTSAVSHHPHFDCSRGQRVFWWGQSYEQEQNGLFFLGGEIFWWASMCWKMLTRMWMRVGEKLGLSVVLGVGRTCLRRLRSALARLRPTDSN